MVTKKQAKELQKLQWMKDEYIKENKRMLKLMEKQQDKVNQILDKTQPTRTIKTKYGGSIIRRSKR